jgi:large subunit ribosomal protein L21
MYAVLKTGGKQYKVSPGDIIVVEKLLGNAGAKIKLDQVMIVGEDGKDPEVGLPMLSNTAVNCEVVDQSRSNKIIVFKKKRRQGYKRKKGHRQEQTVLRVIDINGKGAVKKKSAVAKPKTDKKKTIESKANEVVKEKKDNIVKNSTIKKSTETKSVTLKKNAVPKKKMTETKTSAEKTAVSKAKSSVKKTKEK